MKQISELMFPEGLRYSRDHEWAVFSGQTVKIGITDYAQDQLGDVVYVELPQVGDVIETGNEFGSIESVKAVSELYIPMGGEVVAVNGVLEDTPGLVCSQPYGDGWIIEIMPSDRAEFEGMMSAGAYLKSLN